MSAGAEVEAQAKINLRLRILAREASGFHQLETLFLRITLADTVRVRRTPSGRSLDVTGVDDPASLGDVEQNLAWRAADAWLAAAGGRGGFAVELDKRIPVGGGLGGGSADAGAVLRAMDALAPRPLGEPALLRIAATLGADVPFLTSTAPFALAWGRGERMLALPAPPPRPLLLVIPPFAVHTAEAFRWLAACREGDGEVRPGAAGMLLEAHALRDWSAIAAVAGNDFQEVVAARHPVIGDIVGGITALGCEIALLSGSGSVVFGVLPAGRSVDPDVGSRVDGGERWRLLTVATADRVEPVRMLD